MGFWGSPTPPKPSPKAASNSTLYTLGAQISSKSLITILALRPFGFLNLADSRAHETLEIDSCNKA